MGDEGDTLEELLRVHKFLLSDDATFANDVKFDRNILEELIQHAQKLTEPKKTSRRAAIEAQKARKAANAG